MKRYLLALAVLLTCGLSSATASFAATTGTSAVTLGAAATVVLEVLDPTMTLTPTATDYANDFVDAIGASGLRVRLKCSSTTGAVLNVKCVDVSPQIALADFLVKTQTAAGSGGSTMSSYNAITAADQLLWSTGATQGSWLTVTTDIRIQNLFAYPDAMAGGTTSYTNNLTYTVVAQ